MADIMACFCFGRIHADLTGAFCFIADNLYNLAAAMVFGLTTSASSWEAFGQTIKALTNVFANRWDLVIKHKKYLNMFKWDETNPHVLITRAYPCAINWGIINENGTCLDLPARLYINDALELATDRAHMETVLAAAIKAIFDVMGKPDTPLAMDKWLESVIGSTQTILGLIINTNKLTISLPYKYLNKVLNLLNLTWHPNQCYFRVSEAETLTAKLVHLAEGANWVFHLLSN
jgi:hypothetical protein